MEESIVNADAKGNRYRLTSSKLISKLYMDHNVHRSSSMMLECIQEH